MKYNKFNPSENSGITLVALIITIVLLFILAAVSLASIIGDQGLIDKSKGTKNSYTVQSEKQEILNALATLNTERLLNPNLVLNETRLENQLNNNENNVTVTRDESENYVITFQNTGHEFIMNSSGEIIEVNNVDIMFGLNDSAVASTDSPTPPEPDTPTNTNTDPTDIYVTLYSDGTLAFSNTEETLSDKTVSNSYGNIKGVYFETADLIPWNSQASNITTTLFVNEVVPTYTARWFQNCTNLTEINNIQNLNTARSTTTFCMFYNCSSLNNLDVSKFNTSNVTSMKSMFFGCSNLSSLNLLSFNTSKVRNMAYMFAKCTNLTSLDVSSFNTSSVTNMSYMFGYSSPYYMALKDIKGLENFNTSNVTTMQSMFTCCDKISSLDLRSFNTSNVTSVSSMFYNCTSLKTIYVGNNWNIQESASSSSMFYNCPKLIGGNKTSYDSDYTDAERAVGDTPSTAGYLTLVNDQVNLKANNTDIDYIESTGSQYFDTLYYPNQNTKIDLVMESINWNDSNTAFGVRTQGNSSNAYSNRYALWLYNDKNYYFHIGKRENRKNNLLNYSYTNTKFHLIIENGKLNIQDIKNNYNPDISQFDKVERFKSDYSLYLGAVNEGKTEPSNLCSYKIYSCKIYEGNTLVRDFSPVYNTILSQAGLYDNVEGRFYYGSGINFFSYPH